MIKPRIEVLSKEEIEEMHWRSLKILSKVGILVEHEGALKLLHDIGAEVDFNKKIAKIPEHIVREALKRAPHIVRLYYRDGKRYIELEPNWNTYFSGIPGPYLYVDWKTNEIRSLLSRDLADWAKVIDALPNIHMASYLVPADVPEIITDRWEVYVLMKNTTKPLTATAYTFEGVPDVVKLMAAVIGEENVSKKPILLHPICSASPLKWDKRITQILMDCAKYGIPARLTPMPSASGTSPATLAGTILQTNAEVLAGLVIAQFTKPGAPIVYCASSVILDQRTAIASTGGIEMALKAAAYSQLAKFYGLPCGYSAFMTSDAKVPDEQATLEAAFHALIATLSGMNLVLGAGALIYALGVSLVKLVIDDDIAGSALRFTKGIQIDVETLADWLIEEAGPGGQFLKYKHTREWIRREYYVPKLLSRSSISMWKEKGSKTLGIVAKEYVEKILKEHVVEPLPPDVEKDLNKTMLEIAKRYGIEKLPQI
jgi:trimethylamine--corrinoid protein Co-methyltransferase